MKYIKLFESNDDENENIKEIKSIVLDIEDHFYDIKEIGTLLKPYVTLVNDDGHHMHGVGKLHISYTIELSGLLSIKTLNDITNCLLDLEKVITSMGYKVSFDHHISSIDGEDGEDEVNLLSSFYIRVNTDNYYDFSSPFVLKIDNLLKDLKLPNGFKYLKSSLLPNGRIGVNISSTNSTNIRFDHSNIKLIYTYLLNSIPNLSFTTTANVLNSDNEICLIFSISNILKNI